MIVVHDLKAEFGEPKLLKGHISHAARTVGEWLVRVINAIGTPYETISADDPLSDWLGFPF